MRKSAGAGIGYPLQDSWASLVAQRICPQCGRPGLGRSLEKGMATHSSILTSRIPWTIYYSMDYTVHGVAKSRTILSHFHFHLAGVKKWHVGVRNTCPHPYRCLHGETGGQNTLLKPFPQASAVFHLHSLLRCMRCLLPR